MPEVKEVRKDSEREVKNRAHSRTQVGKDESQMPPGGPKKMTESVDCEPPGKAEMQIGQL